MQFWAKSWNLPVVPELDFSLLNWVKIGNWSNLQDNLSAHYNYITCTIEFLRLDHPRNQKQIWQWQHCQMLSWNTRPSFTAALNPSRNHEFMGNQNQYYISLRFIVRSMSIAQCGIAVILIKMNSYPQHVQISLGQLQNQFKIT